MGFINNYLRRIFYKIGECVGEKPVFFIVVSVFISLFLGSGLIVSFKYEGDFEKLFSTKHGASEKEMLRVNEIFPPGQPGSFEPSRRTRVGSLAR